MEPTRVGINGFGRIGRAYIRAVADDSEIKVVGINDCADADTLAHLLKYDSIHGEYGGLIRNNESVIKVDGKEIVVFNKEKPKEIEWGSIGAEIIIEASGLFTKYKHKGGGAYDHIERGAKKVIITAPAIDDDIKMIVMGVNDNGYDPEKHDVLSNASCTTNALAPIVKVINRSFGIESGLMTTIHSYTNDQRIIDAPHSDMRRMRAASLSMIPTTTGAAKAIGYVIPELKGKLDGIAVRVPTPNVSLVDLVCKVKAKTCAASINQALSYAVEKQFRGILEYSDKSLVSSDYNGNPASAIVDSLSTQVLNGNHVKVLAWYDNEVGYANRLADMVKLVGGKK